VSEAFDPLPSHTIAAASAYLAKAAHGMIGKGAGRSHPRGPSESVLLRYWIVFMVNSNLLLI
jgi:hypothetical protein